MKVAGLGEFEMWEFFPEVRTLRHFQNSCVCVILKMGGSCLCQKNTRILMISSIVESVEVMDSGLGRFHKKENPTIQNGFVLNQTPTILAEPSFADRHLIG